MNTRNHRMSCVDIYKTANGCEICGYKKSPRSLCFDHLPEFEKAEICKNGYSKSNNCGGMQMFYAKKYPVSDLINEIRKCRILCMNCHMEITYANRVKCLANKESMTISELEKMLNFEQPKTKQQLLLNFTGD